jgi:hypothetical protein
MGMTSQASRQKHPGHPQVGPVVPVVGGGHEVVPTPLLVLFILLGVTARAALVSVLLSVPLGLQGAKDGSNRSSPEAKLVAMSNSSLVVRGPLHPSLWTRSL